MTKNALLEKGQKIRAWVDAPLIQAMPERKRFFSIDVFPNLGVLIFSKLHWILAFLENCCECADFIITNGKKSRNQRLINFASSGYPYRHFSYSPDPPTRL